MLCAKVKEKLGLNKAESKKIKYMEIGFLLLLFTEFIKNFSCLIKTGSLVSVKILERIISTSSG